MIVLYRILFPFLLLLALPYYGARMLKRGGYGKDLRHRFGRIDPLPPRKPGVKRIWVQAVSVGEIRAIQPVIDGLNERADIEIVLTTTTSTGYALAREHYRDSCLANGIFPIDWLPFSARTWDRIQPDLAVLMEGDLWPEHLHQARKRNVPAILVNGRMSDRSFRRYQKVGGLAQWLFAQIDQVYAGSTQDADRFRELGVPTDRLETTGNIKFDVQVKPILDAAERRALRTELGFPENALVLLGSSTWPGEEVMLAQTLLDARKDNPNIHLLIIPRHAERRKEIRRDLEQFPFRFAFRTEEKADGALDIYVGDTTGELAMLSQAADVAFIGKSLPPHTEGQTPIEAAALGLPIVYGPGMGNFRRVCQSLQAEAAAIRATDAADARHQLLTLLRDPAQRQTMTTCAQRWHTNNRGAANRVVDALVGKLGK
ncbi:3-deoxy-D-manno-octulosonic acid transferase [Cerasicoccus fimbriatus]|uniref:3-deoxy-D-manno-octulosonic acid transferase n=1 Tax=Cerasicoccus fimbriatus TaxID=3014554 RepID=UPI0022B2F52B|nr:glycosyltransferase N-terminal domain-containing protein [Cerasicoccus sp. TK19100]